MVDYRYGYDDAGNRTYMQRVHQPTQPADVYQYDDLYQLTQVWYGADAADPGSITAYDRLQTYDLDLAGNRLEVENDGLGEVYLPNDGQRLTDAMNRYQQVDVAPLNYDPRGNTLADGANTYTYDLLNRQTGVVSGTVATEYLYDALGRRVAKVTAGMTITHFVYDVRYRVIEERDGEDQLLVRYTYGAGIDEPLTMERGGSTFYYHRDAPSALLRAGLGSITEVTDGSGDLVERYEYDVYGAVVIFDGAGITRTASAIGNVYLFTARRYDPESGNYYYRARVYSPGLGRFLSMDPIGFNGGDYNLYRYAFNNATRYVDPSGYAPPCSLVGTALTTMLGIPVCSAPLASQIAISAVAGIIEVKLEWSGPSDANKNIWGGKLIYQHHDLIVSAAEASGNPLITPALLAAIVRTQGGPNYPLLGWPEGIQWRFGLCRGACSLGIAQMDVRNALRVEEVGLMPSQGCENETAELLATDPEANLAYMVAMLNYGDWLLVEFYREQGEGIPPDIVRLELMAMLQNSGLRSWENQVAAFDSYSDFEKYHDKAVSGNRNVTKVIPWIEWSRQKLNGG